MRAVRRITIFLILALIIGWSFKVLFFDGSSWDITGTVAKKKVTAPMTEEIRSFSLSGFSESGKKTWQVEGKTANILSESIALSEVDADIYGEKVKANITSDSGMFDRKTNDIELIGNVVMVTDEGTRLTTDKMAWQAQQELITTDEHVLIERSDMDIDGTGASARPNLKVAQLNKDIRVNVKDPVAVITCDGPLQVDYNNNVAYFNNNVKLDDGKTQIDADKSTAYFDPERRTLSKVVSQGNVKIRRGENETYAEELTYFPEEGRVLLTGRPKIMINSTEDIADKGKVQ